MTTSVGNHQVCHFEIPADNVDSLKNFYSSLFGWQFEKGGDTRLLYDKECRNQWSISAQKENPQQVSTQFVNVESIEEYISKAKQLGARVIKNINRRYQKDIIQY